MHTLAEILGEKSGDVIRIGGDATVYEAVLAMVEANVGALLVTEGDEISGIFTERDYLRRIAVEGRRSRRWRIQARLGCLGLATWPSG